jgi:hypothetical protein
VEGISKFLHGEAHAYAVVIKIHKYYDVSRSGINKTTIKRADRSYVEYEPDKLRK